MPNNGIYAFIVWVLRKKFFEWFHSRLHCPAFPSIISFPQIASFPLIVVNDRLLSFLAITRTLSQNPRSGLCTWPIGRMSSCGSLPILHDFEKLFFTLCCCGFSSPFSCTFNHQSI
jgi:hypothetical protein